MNFRFFISTVLCLLGAYASSQAYYRQYTTADGLISNTFYHVFKDSKGYLWFSSDKGICKYDGKSFRNYTILDGLTDNDVFNFYEDDMHRLWLFTFNGEACYIRNDSVFNINNDSLLRKMPVVSFLVSVSKGKDSSLYFGYCNGVLVKVRGTKLDWIYKLPYDDTKISVVRQEGDILKLTTNEHNVIIQKNKITYEDKSQYGYFIQDKFIITDSLGIEVYKDDKPIFRYNDRELNLYNVINIYCDDRNNIFCSTFNGLTIVNYITGESVKLFRGLQVTSAAQDIYGNYWITTLNNGVYRINKEFNSGRIIRNISASKIVYARTGQFFLKDHDSVFVFRSGTFQKLPMLFNNKLQPLYLTHDLFFFSNGQETFIRNMHSRQTAMLHRYTKHIYAPSPGRLLRVIVGFSNLTDDSITTAGIVSSDSIILKNRIIESAFNATAKRLYFLSGNNLFRYEGTNKEFALVDTFPGIPLGIFYANDKIIVTGNSDITVYDETHGYTRVRFSIGDVVIFELYGLNKYAYLLHTNKGFYLLWLYPSQFIPSLQKIEYPFKSSDVHFMYPYKDSILCNVNDALCIFPQRLLYEKSGKPVLFIDNIMVNNKIHNATDITTLYARKANISILAGALYFNNLNNYYQYRVTHNNERSEWYKSEGGNINILLSGFGDYDIEVRTITENNIVSVAKHIGIVLLPPFYLTTWFLGLCMIMIVSIAGWLVYLYLKKRKAKFQNELHYLQLEHKAINSLLNPHFIFNAINNIQSLVNEGRKEQANNYLAMLSKLIRQNIENLKFDFISLDKELTLINNYIKLQNLRFNDTISLRVNNNLPSLQDIYVPPLLIHTFIENAIVHGYRKDIPDFTITIDLSLSTDDYLIINITDNGVGYDEKAASQPNNNDKTSMGIKFTIQRLERLSEYYHVMHSLQIIDLHKKEKRGTEVIIILYSKFSEFFTVS